MRPGAQVTGVQMQQSAAQESFISPQVMAPGSGYRHNFKRQKIQAALLYARLHTLETQLSRNHSALIADAKPL